MRAAALFSLIIITAGIMSVSVHAQSPDDALKIYAVNVVKYVPFKEPFTGYGIYLGNGAVITAAHVVGRWPSLKTLRVLIAGQDLPAKIIKEGSLEEIDVTLLSVDEARLPLSLRLRRNPLCKEPPRIGENVIVAVPERTARSQIMSRNQIEPEYRARFGTLISDLAGTSGSGVFDAEKRCLRGIISRKVPKYDRRIENGRIIMEPAGFAGYFVPASQITEFLPPEFRF